MSARDELAEAAEALRPRGKVRMAKDVSDEDLNTFLHMVMRLMTVYSIKGITLDILTQAEYEAAGGDPFVEAEEGDGEGDANMGARPKSKGPQLD